MRNPSSSLFNLKSLSLLISASALCSPSLAQTGSTERIEEMVITADGSQVLLPEAYAGGQVARGGRVGVFGNLDMMDAPFTSTNYTAELMLDQQTSSVADVLQNDPVVRVAKGFGNFQELYVIRGFPVFSDDMTYNGLYGILPRQYVASELLERVEVFRGANTFLSGAAPGGSGIGGSVNLVPKRAPEDGVRRVTLGLEGQSQGYAALDFGERFGAEQETGVRANLVRRDGETAVENQERELTLAAIGTDYRGDRLRLSADLGFQDHRIDAPRPSVTPTGELPEAPDSDRNFAQPWTYTDEQQLFGVVRAEYDLTDHITGWAAAGLREGEEDNILANPNSDAEGNTSTYRFDNVREDSVRSAEIGVKSEFQTGTVSHRLVGSATDFSSESRNAYAFSDFAGFSGNLYNPEPVAPPAPDFFVGGDLSAPGVTERVDNQSVALADMLGLLGDTLLVTLGARYQDIHTRSYDYTSGNLTSEYDEGRLSPVAGVVYQPSDQVSLYGNYIEGLMPGEVAPATSGGEPVDNAGEVFEPYQAEQIEVGLKYDADTYGGSISLFDTALPSGYVENNRFSVNGEQRNRGLELSAFGQPLDTMRVLGGLTFLDSEQTQTQGGLYDGKQAVGVPEFQLNLNLEWDLTVLPGLTLDTRIIHTDDQYANADNTVSASAWTRWDLGARYQTEWDGRGLTLRARVNNLSDENYWASVGGFPGSNYLVLSEPRSLVLSASVEF
ncbi:MULTISPECIES: TonB-dependent receptor [unclassified Marinimicrobium]|jgi:iron complex outermembrane receptor protein|uniref:TonB-dependent receptor n=1 Tax=unclassified Marinimicrobium TaxID=2632100 RepID=UPI000C669109|nr:MULTISPECIES: TonB-dependent receptor [unclassified Marinimicrobium]MAN52597.1 TonB-dependent siderophore receptor [Marinimicrobium sp.]